MGTDPLTPWKAYLRWCAEQGKHASPQGFDAWLSQQAGRIDVI